MKYYDIYTGMSVDEIRDYLIENVGVSEEILQVVTDINGCSEQIICDIFYAVTDYHALNQIDDWEMNKIMKIYIRSSSDTSNTENKANTWDMLRAYGLGPNFPSGVVKIDNDIYI